MFKDWAVPLYSWFTIFVYGKIVEMFQTENPNRAVFIVSRKTQELKTLIVDKMGMRGTFIHGKGMYQEMRLRLYSRSLNEKICPA